MLDPFPPKRGRTLFPGISSEKGIRPLFRRARDITGLTAQSFWRGFLGFYHSDNLTYAASIAYYALLSLFPFFLLALTIIGRMAADPEDRADVLEFVLRYFPRQFEFITHQLAGFSTNTITISVAGAICYSVYNISTRVLARTDSNQTTLFYSNFVGTVAALPALPFVWTTPHEPVVIALMVLIGALGSFGHYLLIAAHRLASASVLAPFIYSQLIWAITAGYLVFGQLPSEWTLAGAAIVIASGLYILYREHKLRG